jgi:AAA15 family ATPase/GTPase
MARKKTAQAPQPNQPEQKGITRITVANFKSIVGEQSIEIRPLTILAGANSSGKSSMMQPLLLLKQTLEAPYDPGALLLNGPNARFTLAAQLLSFNEEDSTDTFSAGLEVSIHKLSLSFTKNRPHKPGFRISEMQYTSKGEECILRDDLSEEEIDHVVLASQALQNLAHIIASLMKISLDPQSRKPQFLIKRERCFLKVSSENPLALETLKDYTFPNTSIISRNIRHIIHVPGLRGNPERSYPVTAVGSTFPGTFEKYVASVIGSWSGDKLRELNHDLAKLGLTNHVLADPIDDTQVELVVNRRKHSHDEEDMVNIADVGFGVSQALPVVVALHAAEPGQLVYIEQPEIHLHPRAQAAMAEVLADAAIQGKRVVIETHSDLVLSGIQTLVAEGKLPPELVKLHWFEQLSNGSTKITSSELDQAGAFGDWPEDFHKVILAAENRYLDAAEARLLGE